MAYVAQVKHHRKLEPTMHDNGDRNHGMGTGSPICGERDVTEV